jgi:hypothetical protein
VIRLTMYIWRHTLSKINSYPQRVDCASTHKTKTKQSKSAKKLDWHMKKETPPWAAVFLCSQNLLPPPHMHKHYLFLPTVSFQLHSFKSPLTALNPFFLSFSFLQTHPCLSYFFSSTLRVVSISFPTHRYIHKQTREDSLQTTLITCPVSGR